MGQRGTCIKRLAVLGSYCNKSDKQIVICGSAWPKLGGNAEKKKSIVINSGKWIRTNPQMAQTGGVIGYGGSRQIYTPCISRPLTLTFSL